LLERDLAFKRARPFIERGAWLTPAVAGTVKQWPHWLALAGMAVFFTRESHAAPVSARYTMNRID
jgi:hypothetical protein